MPAIPSDPGAPLDSATRKKLIARLGAHWREEDGVLVRRISYRGYANIARFTGAVAELAEQMDHHPDVKFGWGYCEVRYTTHSAKGLTRKDFEAAEKVDRLAEAAFPRKEK